MIPSDAEKNVLRTATISVMARFSRGNQRIKVTAPRGGRLPSVSHVVRDSTLHSHHVICTVRVGCRHFGHAHVVRFRCCVWWYCLKHAAACLVSGSMAVGRGVAVYTAIIGRVQTKPNPPISASYYHSQIRRHLVSTRSHRASRRTTRAPKPCRGGEVLERAAYRGSVQCIWCISVPGRRQVGSDPRTPD